MARRSAQPPNPPEIHQFRTVTEIDAAISRLQRRIGDIEKLRDDKVRRDDPKVRIVQEAIVDAIRELFGKGSPQFQRHSYFAIDDGPRTLVSDFGYRGGHEHGQQLQFEQHVPGAIARLEGLIEALRERRTDLAQPHVAPRVAFQGRNLHPAIVGPCEPLYLTGHYAQAVFEAGKALIERVKAKSGRADIDGVPLMQAVFSAKDPILAFNQRADRADEDEQQGMMHLYIGAAMGVRNPGGHRVGATIEGGRALQYLELFSLLADLLDDAKRVK